MSIRFERILLPTDFSDVASAALRYARKLMAVFDAKLHCLHVVDDTLQYWSTMGPEGVPVRPVPDDILNASKTRMGTFAKEQLADLRSPAVTHVSLGRPFAEIIRYTRENKIDLIVMGTHGRGAIAHVLLGSTTEKVVRKSPCAVLTVRAEEHEFVMP